MTARVLTIAAAAAAGVTLAACGNSSKSSSAGTAGTGQTQSQAPPAVGKNYRVAFVNPAKGATVGSTFTAKVKLAHFKIAPNAVGQAPQAGEGHLHFTLDNGKFDYPKYSGANGKIGKSLGVNGRYSPALAPTITYSHVPAGRHTLTVILANNNHTPTGAAATLQFSVR